MKSVSLISYTLLYSILSINGFKILTIFPDYGKSHLYFVQNLVNSLVKKGHDVTVISYFKNDELFPGCERISIGNETEIGHLRLSNNSYIGGSYRRYFVPYVHLNRAYLACNGGLSNPRVLKLINSSAAFDLVIVELFNTKCFFGLIYKLQCPFIGISTSPLFPWFDSITALSNNPSYMPNTFTSLSTKMTFLERVENILANVFHNLQFDIIVDQQDTAISHKYLGNNLPLLGDVVANLSLILVNSHFSISGSRPNVPTVIEIGGMHLGNPKSTPRNIEKWINESTHGVIYFSMGSMIKGHTFPEEKRQMFLRAFARLPQRVLWKWETETMPQKPDNVMLLKWMPQFDILCHPNVKAFISHGGLLGVTESVHCGVPMLLMPQFGDQFTNAKAIEANGGGIMLDFRYITEEMIFESLSTILSDSFNQKAKELSERFRDRPMPPLETAIYWVEYVARHKGAPHLRTAAVGMPLYKYLLLDVIAFILAVLAVVSYVLYRILKAIFRLIFTSKQKVKTN